MKHRRGEPFKPGQVLLAHIDEQPAFFLRVENIKADLKPRWWRMEFIILTLPLVQTTWILDDEQIRGTPFTMSGRPVRLEKVEKPTSKDTENKKDADADTAPANVISLFDQKK